MQQIILAAGKGTRLNMPVTNKCLVKVSEKAKNVWRERKFIAAVSELDTGDRLSDVMKNSGGMIKGIIDLIFEEDDGFVIVDYKSDRGASAQKLAERYALQLRLYRSAVELTMCKKVKAAYLYSFELQKAILLDI